MFRLTIQRRTEFFLKESLLSAKRGGFGLGVKLVRGAYHEQELERSKQSGCSPLVWTSKKDTDTCYDHCASIIIASLQEDLHAEGPKTAVLFGTHNRKSIDYILQLLESRQLATHDPQGTLSVDGKIAERVAFAQLYGKHVCMAQSFRCRISYL